MAESDPASPAKRKSIRFLISLGVAVALSWLLKEPAFTTDQTFVLFLVFFSVALWITEAVPPFAVALMIIACLVFTMGYDGLTANRSEIKIYTDTFSSSVIWLLLGGYFLASSLTNTGLDAAIIGYSIKLFGSRPQRILFGVMGVTVVASMFFSNTTTTAMVIAAIMPLIHTIGRTSPLSKALVVGIPLASALGGLGTLIGSPSNLMTVEAAMNAGSSIDFVDWLYFGIPITVVLMALSMWTLSRLYLKGQESIPDTFRMSAGTQQVNKSDRVIAILVLAITVGFWVTSPLHGLSAAVVSAIPLVVLPMAGIVKAEHVRGMGWDTLILIAGGLSLGEGLKHSGLLQLYADRITELHFGPTAILFFVAYLTMVLSNVMNSSSTCAILLPLGISIFPENVLGISMTIGLSTLTAVLLPVSSPPNAIAYNTGIIEQKDLVRGGLAIALLGPAIIVLWVMLLTNILH